MIVAFTGIREIADIMSDEVELAVLDEIGSGATELRFGGALGSDTLALEAACDHDVRRVVYVPFRLCDQPDEAREVVESCADNVIELRRRKGTKSAYFERNRALVDGADRLVAFTDGREGGTAFTIREAERAGIPVAVVPVRGTGRRSNPQLRGVEFTGPVHALAEYVSERRGRHVLSDLVRRNKIGKAKPKEIQDLAAMLSAFVARTPVLAGAEAIVAMPRRQPHARSDMAALARAIGRTAGLDVRDLIRVTEPLGGVESARRLRFPAEEHARTLHYEGPPGATVIVLDNVITTGASMEGAMLAVRAAGATPVGLAVLFSESFDLEPF